VDDCRRGSADANINTDIDADHHAHAICHANRYTCPITDSHPHTDGYDFVHKHAHRYPNTGCGVG